MDRRTDGQIPPVFYRTLSPPVPSGAAAQKGEKEAGEGKEKEKTGEKMTIKIKVGKQKKHSFKK